MESRPINSYLSMAMCFLWLILQQPNKIPLCVTRTDFGMFAIVSADNYASKKVPIGLHLQEP